MILCKWNVAFNLIQISIVTVSISQWLILHKVVSYDIRGSECQLLLLRKRPEWPLGIICISLMMIYARCGLCAWLHTQTLIYQNCTSCYFPSGLKYLLISCKVVGKSGLFEFPSTFKMADSKHVIGRHLKKYTPIWWMVGRRMTALKVYPQ